MTAAALAADGPVAATALAIAQGRWSAAAAVGLALDRLAAHPELNCTTELRGDLALREAAALDARLAAGESPGPLVGVPVLVKDLEDVTGMVTGAGSALFAAAAPATEDAWPVARLRDAGAVVVGKSTLPELATEGFTDSLVCGPTRNPWSLEHSPGGSSGGSAAALAAGLVPVATAPDGGGSGRIPAAVCGLLG
ncbi:MAG: amidase, partial [Nocardioides sp.]|nr:amidase [Nocardioides sp.]